MKKALIIGAFLLAIIGIPACSISNRATDMEQGILAEKRQVEIRLSQALTTIKGQDSQADAYDAQTKDIVDQLSGMFSDSKSAGMFLAQSYPDISPALRQQVMQTLEIRFADKANSETSLIDRIRAYDAWRKKTPRRFFLQVMGFPSQEYLSANPGELILEKDAQDAIRNKGFDIDEIVD